MIKPRKRRIALRDWRREGVRRFGPRMREWRFSCPVCGHVAKVADFVDLADLTPEQACERAPRECLGRYLPRARPAFADGVEVEGPGPCDYAAFGLFRLAPVEVLIPSGDVLDVFAFPPETEEIPCKS